LTEEEYWTTTPAQLGAMVKAHRQKEKRHTQRFAALMALLANINRNPDTTPEPFKASDFMAGRRRKRRRRSSSIGDRAFFELMVSHGLAARIE
jgi:hypothetical protein